MSNALDFIKRAALPASFGQPGTKSADWLKNTEPNPPDISLDNLPAGIVAGNALIDYSSAPTPEVRSGVSLALLFAGQAARASMKDGDDEDDWLAAYMTNLGELGFNITQTGSRVTKFKKRGVLVHKAIIPLLTIAFGGASLGPVILAALENLKKMDEDEPWVTLFDKQSHHFNAREMHFAVVNSDSVNTNVRHVVARLYLDSGSVNILFFKISDVNAELETTTTTMTVNNSLLAIIEPRLRERLEGVAKKLISEATLKS